MGHHTPARRLLRALGAAAPLAAAGGCEYLSFAKMLRPPAFTGARGHRSTDRGPAYAPAAALPAAADPAADWGSYNNAPDGTRWSPLAQVTAANVAGLRRACALDLGERTPMQSGPVVVGGVLYVTSAKRTWAMDAATCRLRWQHTYAYHPKPAFDLKTNRGVAYVTADDGRGGRRPLLVRGANDGRVYAVDARTGREVWNVGAGDPGRGETFPAAPVAWTPPGGRPLVFLGNAGGDNYAVTGRLMAFDAATGSRVWSFDFVPRAGAAAGTWPAETDSVPRAGATTWTTYTLDTLAGTVYVPTGNASPNFLPQLRPGTNDHTNSVVALDARTGAFRRAYKVLALDSHDYDVAAAPVLLAPGGGAPVVAVAGKDGYLHAFDRDGGRRLWASPTTTLLNDTVAPTPEGVRFCPGVQGGAEWNGPAYDPTSGTLVVGTVDWCTTVRTTRPDALEGKPGVPWTGSARLFEPFGRMDPRRDARGWVAAFDAATGRPRWRFRAPAPVVAGVTATAGGLTFTADQAGTVYAFDTRTGAVRWRHDAGMPVGGGVVTYAVGGRQYVAVAAGLHAPLTWQVTSPKARVLVFALP
jgi:alcohol dehydrogenase (cytochrome c)